ncbi:MAG TPA: SDR family oxidoreductase [Phycisphaerae bacterium]|nr:SDR family oxidoreductase [Phycisphaerae bacterium]
MIDLKGHAAFITGASRGVGRAIAEAFAEAGAHVVVNSRKFSDDTQSLLDKCKSLGVSASFVPGDLSDQTEKVVDEVFHAATAARPDIDILVNNAGQYFDVPFLEMDCERFFKTIRLNVASGYFLTQRFARRWVAGKTPGRVLFIGSINGKLAEQVSTAYDSSKGAVEMMVRTLAVALAPHNIRVNGLAPGLVRTPQTSWLDRQPAKAAWIAHHTPNGRIPDAAACGPGAVYLVSDAASHVHGHMLMIDGGMSVWQQPEPM